MPNKSLNYYSDAAGFRYPEIVEKRRMLWRALDVINKGPEKYFMDREDAVAQLVCWAAGVAVPIVFSTNATHGYVFHVPTAMVYKLTQTELAAVRDFANDCIFLADA